MYTVSQELYHIFACLHSGLQKNMAFFRIETGGEWQGVQSLHLLAVRGATLSHRRRQIAAPTKK